MNEVESFQENFDNIVSFEIESTARLYNHFLVRSLSVNEMNLSLTTSFPTGTSASSNILNQNPWWRSMHPKTLNRRI